MPKEILVSQEDWEDRPKRTQQYMDQVSDDDDCDSEYQCDSDLDTDEEEMYLEEMCLLCDPKRNMRALKRTPETVQVGEGSSKVKRTAARRIRQTTTGI